MHSWKIVASTVRIFAFLFLSLPVSFSIGPASRCWNDRNYSTFDEWMKAGNKAFSSRKKICCYSRALDKARGALERAAALLARANAHFYYQLDFMGETWERASNPFDPSRGMSDPNQNDVLTEEARVPRGLRKKDGFEDYRRVVRECDRGIGATRDLFERRRFDLMKADACFGIACFYFWKAFTEEMKTEGDPSALRAYLGKSLDFLEECITRDKWCSTAYDLRARIYDKLEREGKAAENREIRDFLRTVDEPQGRGRGLTGYYFDSIQCKGHDGNATRIDTWSLKGSRTDSRVHVNWGEGSPGFGIAEDTFAVVWKGRFRAPRKGTYRFSATADDGIKVFVDHQCLVDGWHNHQERTYDSKEGVDLEAGQFMPLSIEFYDIVYDSWCTLYVQGPGISRRIVPQQWLYPASEPPFAQFPELWEMGPGEYRSWFDVVDTGDYALAGDFNDSLSGLTVPPRYKVTLALHYGMGGRRRSFDGPARFGEGLLKHYRLNDEVSSVRVETRGAYGK